MVYRIPIIILLLISLLFGFKKDPIGSLDSGFSFFGANLSSKNIEYTIPSYELKKIESDGSEVYQPIFKSNSMASEIGVHDFPSTSTFYAVDKNKTYTYSIDILEEETFEDIQILKHKPLSRVSSKLESSENFEAIKHSSSQFPVVISDKMFFRELSVVKVVFNPFQYDVNEKKLKIIKRANIEIIELEYDEDSEFTPQTRSKAFEPLYKSLVVNYEALNRNSIPYQRPSILYVLPNNIGNLIGTVEVLFDWKRRLGYDVNVVSSSQVVNSTSNLKNYIQNAYQTWENPPEFVTIIADAEGTYDVPSYFDNWSGYNGEGDHPYTQLTGDDLLPEVFIGRMSFDTQSHLSTIISKHISYESSPYMGQNWFKRAGMVGDPASSGISTIITNEHIIDILELNGFNEIETIYDGSFASQMQSSLSSGVGYFNYRGFYGVSGFTSDNIGSTTNGFMLPIATVLTCGTGSFASEESISEEFIRAGTASNPKGSVVCVGTATLGTHTMFNNIVNMGFYYGAFIEGNETVGAALMSGKLWLTKTYPTNPERFVETFTHWNNLMGDASLKMWTDFPRSINVNHSYAVSRGTNYIDISVNDGSGNPIEDAWVTIYRENQILESSYSDENGNVTLNIPSNNTGEVLITVSKKNIYPYQSSFQIYDPGVSVNLTSSDYIIIDDGSGQTIGNGDGQINPGETVSLLLSLTNFGTVAAENISAQIETDNINVSIISNPIVFGPISSGQNVTSPYPFIFSVVNGLENGDDLGLRVVAQDQDYLGESRLNIELAGKSVEVISVSVSNGQNILNPGESSIVNIDLINYGLISTNNLTGTITSASSSIEIIDNSGSWNTIQPNASASTNSSGNSFEIQANDDVIPGSIANLIITVSSEDGYSSTSLFPLQIGSPSQTDPVGPDNYGYYIYDNGDVEYLSAPSYNWIEIDDRYDGSGTYLSSLDDNGDNDDDVQVVNLPFTFRFYGKPYDQISICSNGWISFGETEMTSFRNYQLPGAGGPSPMIAAFWDDLKLTNNGRVYTYFDFENKQYIIQWSRVRTYQNNDTESFQLILKDPAYYLTPTNDGEILIQYQDFNNTTNGSYGWNQIHGSYCTIGIEDQYMTTGLEYTYNNQYHPAAMPLQDESAILITTKGSEVRMSGDLDMDGNVGINDIMILVDYITEINTNINPFLADINSDGLVNILDMISIVQVIMGYNQ